MTQLKKDLKIKAKGSLLSAPLILRKYIKIKISVSLKLTAIFCGHKNLYCLVWHPTELLLSLLQSLLLLSLYLLLVYHYYCFYCHCLCFNCIVSKNTLYVMYRVLHGLRFIESFLSYTTMAINSPVKSSLSRHFSRDMASS